MNKKNKGNLMVTFIMVIALAAVSLSLLLLFQARLRDTILRYTETRSMYIAEAGLEKAFWRLSTTEAFGGWGLSTFPRSTTEVYSRGRFRVTVSQVVTGEILVVSTGETAGGTPETVSQRATVTSGGGSAAFQYALYTGTAITMNGAVTIYGDPTTGKAMYSNGNVTMNGNTSVYDGDIEHPAGTTITGGSGSWTDGGAPSPLPPPPPFNNSGYTALIATAIAQPSGSVYYNDVQTVNLGGTTMFVDGDVMFNATVTINGPGRIVASGQIIFNGSSTTNGDVEYISQGAMTCNGNTTATGATYYTAGQFIANGSTRIEVGTIMSMGNATFNGSMSMTGLVYTQGTFILQGNPQITGAVCSSAFSGVDTINGSARINYSAAAAHLDDLPDAFGGGAPSTLTRRKGTWKGT